MYGHRLVEKLLASGISMTVVVWFLWGNKGISGAAATGLLFGVLAPSFAMMISLSARVEGWLLTVTVVLIGMKYGLSGFGTYLVGCGLFFVVLLASLTLGNHLRKI